MTTIKLQVSKADVYNEVAKTTGYTGAKMTDDDSAYDRISTTDEDEEMLGRFWNESRAEVAQRLVSLILSEGVNDSGVYELTLGLSSSFDEALQPSMELSLFSYFVQSITAQWYVFTNKGEATGCAARATAMLEDVREKAYYKKKPTRPTYSTPLKPRDDFQLIDDDIQQKA